MIGAPAHAARQFQERDHRARKRQRADGDAERHLNQAGAVDVAGRSDVEGFGRVERTGRDQHRGHADQRVKRRDQFRHRRHRHPARNHHAPTLPPMATPSTTSTQPIPSAGGCAASVVATRDRHAAHAEEVAPAARCRAGEPAQRQDEQDARDKIKYCGEIGVHGLRAPSCAGSTRASI